jgi:predicted short-subunit dehydrogenase-like oxidoreductase (DUF2520 family)
MDISLIGTGNVAYVLSRLLISKGHRLMQVLARDSSAAAALASLHGAVSGSLNERLHPESEVIIMALSDDAYSDKRLSFDFHGKLVLHTSGFLPIQVLSSFSDQYGVLWPLQSLRKEMSVVPEIPFVIEACSESALDKTRTLAKSLSNKIAELNGQDRRKMHLSAVVVNNFTNHLFALAEQYCSREGLDFRMLLPLINQTASRLSDFSPLSLQTGPAIRENHDILDAHLAMLENYPALAKLYDAISSGILETHSKS